MELITKPIPSVSIASQTQQPTTENAFKLEPRLQQSRQLMAKGEYQKALSSLPSSNRDLEVRNVCAVCLMRMFRFEEAVDLLRPVTIHSSINKMREDVPMHIRINFATALYFGGRCEDHPAVKLVREHARNWGAQMSFIRRLDWRLNGIAPKQLPSPPNFAVGICIWDIK